MKEAIVLGIVNGAVWGVLAVGLVLVYKGSRVFNFAQGEFATVGAYVAWLTIAGLGWPYPVGVVIAVAAAAAMGFLTERLVVRPLFNAPRVTLLVATAGVAVGAIQLELIIGRPEVRVLEPALSGRGASVFGVLITPQEYIIVLALLLIGGGLAYFFARTRLGLRILAASQDPLAAQLVGISSKRISSILWTSAAALGGIAGLLLAAAPGQALSPGFVTRNALLAAFAAAVLGGMSSVAGAFVGGVVIGISQQVAQFFLFDKGVPSPDVVVLMALLLLVLLVRPQGILGKEV
jgi:branched-chain amino acid transport system permease protein